MSTRSSGSRRNGWVRQGDHENGSRSTLVRMHWIAPTGLATLKWFPAGRPLNAYHSVRHVNRERG